MSDAESTGGINGGACDVPEETVPASTPLLRPSSMFLHPQYASYGAKAKTAATGVNHVVYRHVQVKEPSLGE